MSLLTLFLMLCSKHIRKANGLVVYDRLYRYIMSSNTMYFVFFWRIPFECDKYVASCAFLMLVFIHGRPFGHLHSVTSKNVYNTSYIHVAKPVQFLAIPVQALITEANSVKSASGHFYEATLNNLFG